MNTNTRRHRSSIYFAGVFKTSCCVAAILATIALCATAAPLTIVNGGFETGTAGNSSLTPIAGWTDAGGTAGFWLQDGDNIPVGSGSFPQDPNVPQSGSLYLTANRLAGAAGSQPASSTLSQTVAIDGGNLILVQSGAAALNLQFFYQDSDGNDSSTVSVSFLNGTSGLISTVTTGTLPDVAANGTAFTSGLAPWTLKNLKGAVPSNAEFIRINITTNRIGGSATNVHFDSFSGVIEQADTDNDGLPDSYEQTIIDSNPGDAITAFSHVAGPNNLPATTDFDSDGSSDANEFEKGTNPLDSDTDDDGLTDGVETNTGSFLIPSNTGTNPLASDTDIDGFNDGIEVFYGSNPVNNTDLPGAGLNVVNGSFESPIVAVSKEGVPVSGGTVTGWSVATNEMWTIDAIALSANDPTSASHGSQFLTANRLAPNPDALAAGFIGGNAAVMSARQDVDVSSFAASIDAGARTVLVKFDWFDNDPFDRGTVSIRFLNGLGVDLGRYRSDVTLGNLTGWRTSILPVYPPVGTRTVRITLEADNRNDAGAPSAAGTARNVHFDNIVARLAFVDSDNDGMPDDWELANGLNPNNPADSSAISSGGGLTNLQEFLAGTSPDLADTDGDGSNDNDEVSAGTDPLDPSSFPVALPPGSLTVASSGFNVSGDFHVTVSGLSTSYSYRLVRGTDLASFPTVVEQKVPTSATDVFTDPEPPASKAFYRVELVTPP